MVIPGRLIAFEGLDQSGKETQARLLAARLQAAGHDSSIASFPDYSTAIGREIERALHEGVHHTPEVMQLLYIANRYERKGDLERLLEQGRVVICDRYVASSIAYGEAQGLDAGWLAGAQRFLPQPCLTLVLEIAPETAVRRKSTGRDRYERDLDLLRRVGQSYRMQAAQPGWMTIDGERPVEVVAEEVFSAVSRRLALQ
jgi:dTMP kinase